MTLTIIALEFQVEMDVIVKPEQRIKEVIGVLTTNFRLPPQLGEGALQIYSRRKKCFIEEQFTFLQAGLYQGDVLEIKQEERA